LAIAIVLLASLQICVPLNGYSVQGAKQNGVENQTKTADTQQTDLTPQKASHAETLLTASERGLSSHLSPMDVANISLAVVAIILSVVAILYAVKQHRDAGETKKVAESISERTQQSLTALSATAETLSSLAMQLPTRYVGKFPDNLTEIVDLLRLASNEAVIVTDFAGYSSYSDPSRFRDYFNAVDSSLRQNRNLTVRLYIYDAFHRERWLQLRYPRAEYPDHVFHNPSDDLLAGFIKRVRKRQIQIVNYETFVAALMDDEERWIRQFEDLDRCECFELHRTVPIFLWMVDKQQCIFAFENEKEVSKNYFSFRTRDGRLLEYFSHYLREIVASANHHPTASIDETSAMNLLVPQLGTCTKIKGRLLPCTYHQDRLDVQYLEQKADAAERDIDQMTVEVSPTSSLLDLFEKMEDKRMPAGGWGLMACHRQWLTEHIAESLKTRADANSPSILQLGTAGPVHYFATAKIIVEAIIKSGIRPPNQALLCTVERCLTPVQCVKSLLATIAAIDSPSNNDWAIIETDGLRKVLDSSFYEIGAEKAPMRELLRHVVALGDICGEHFWEEDSVFDLTITHFTFSMWANRTEADCNKGYGNVARTLRRGGTLLAALSEFHNPAVRSIEQYHESFARVGLHLVSETRAWDVYDLSPAERQRFVYSRASQRFRKRVVLAVYEKS
jgi:hypothetical protein